MNYLIYGPENSCKPGIALALQQFHGGTEGAVTTIALEPFETQKKSKKKQEELLSQLQSTWSKQTMHTIVTTRLAPADKFYDLDGDSKVSDFFDHVIYTLKGKE